jgi:glycosyltransferase involved in cell wall biosynthesis
MNLLGLAWLKYKTLNIMVKNAPLSKPKVLFIVHLPPPVHGAAAIGKYIKTSSLINSEIEAEYINLATTDQLNKIGKGGIKKIFTFIRLIKTVIKALNKKQFDLCYVTLTASGPGFYKDLIIVAILKSYGCKLIYHFHNKGVAQASTSRVNRMLYRYVFKKSKSILLSRHLYYDISMYVKEEDVFYCPNGVPPKHSYIRERTHSEDPKTCKLLYLSNMMAEKGAYVLLDALKHLQSKKIPFECNYVGAWSDITEEAFKAYILENGLEKSVFAHGPKYDNEKESFFKEADIFVFPTYYHYETFGLVNLEAMQYALPIVSTREGGIPDVVADGETGFLVPQKNAEKLADKLELLIKNEELRFNMGQAGKNRYETLFTLDRFEKTFAEVIREAATR